MNAKFHSKKYSLENVIYFSPAENTQVGIFTDCKLSHTPETGFKVEGLKHLQLSTMFRIKGDINSNLLGSNALDCNSSANSLLGIINFGLFNEGAYRQEMSLRINSKHLIGNFKYQQCMRTQEWKPSFDFRLTGNLFRNFYYAPNILKSFGDETNNSIFIATFKPLQNRIALL